MFDLFKFFTNLGGILIVYGLIDVLKGQPVSFPNSISFGFILIWCAFWARIKP